MQKEQTKSYGTPDEFLTKYQNNSNISCKKLYVEFPFSHRQPRHDGHCAWIHGHNWDFEFEFQAIELDDNGFIIDFGKLGFIKEFLTKNFDHTFVIPQDDIEMQTWVDLKNKNLIDLIVVPDASAEGLSKWILDEVNKIVLTKSNGRVYVKSVTVFEDKKNSSTCYYYGVK